MLLYCSNNNTVHVHVNVQVLHSWGKQCFEICHKTYNTSKELYSRKINFGGDLNLAVLAVRANDCQIEIRQYFPSECIRVYIIIRMMRLYRQYFHFGSSGPNRQIKKTANVSSYAVSQNQQ